MASCKHGRTAAAWKCAFLAVALSGLYGCATFEDDTDRAFVTGKKMGDVNMTITTVDARVIMQRKRLGSDDYIVCTEPPPDTAKALQAVLSMEGKGGDGTITAGASMSSATSEAVLELAGRSTALLGLRDGLYRACEAYANGALGADAYALLETRYGQLMTTLFLGQDITSTSNHANTVSAPTINVTAPNSAVQSTTNTGSAQSGDSQPAKATAANGTTAGSEGAKPAASDSAKPAAPDNPKPAVNASPSTPADGGSTSGGGSAGASAVAAVSLARMNEDYLNLDLKPALNLAAVCINAGDTTRTANVRSTNPSLENTSSSSSTGTEKKNQVDTIGNSYLKSLCGDLTLEQLGKFQQAAITFTETVRPLNPADVAGSPSKTPDATAPTLPAPTSWTVSFKSGSTLDDAAKAIILKAITAIQQNAKASVTVEGHTDPTGSDGANMKIALARAKVVADALTALPNPVKITATVSPVGTKPVKTDPSQRTAVISIGKSSQ